MEAVIRVNERQRERMVDKIVAALDGDVRGKTIGMLGLSFKPETDDMREAPSIDIVAGLEAQGASVRAFDPVANEAARKLMPNATLCDDAYEACEEADVLVLMTEWNQFRMLDLERVKSVLTAPIVVDLRNVYEPKSHARGGLPLRLCGALSPPRRTTRRGSIRWTSVERVSRRRPACGSGVEPAGWLRALCAARMGRQRQARARACACPDSTSSGAFGARDSPSPGYFLSGAPRAVGDGVGRRLSACKETVEA